MVPCIARCETRRGHFHSLVSGFINDFVNELENTNLGFGVLDVTSNCHTLADDVMCIALAPRNLQSMLDVAYRYSKRWRFDFNADKSCILCFRARGNRLPQQLTWSLGETTVPCKESYNHLGTHSKMKLNQWVAQWTGAANYLCKPIIMLRHCIFYNARAIK